MSTARSTIAALAATAGLMLAGCGSSSPTGAGASPTDTSCVTDVDSTLGAAGAYIHVTGALGAQPTITAVCDAPTPLSLVTQDIKAGSGATVAAGGVVTAHYVGYGMTSRTVFDSSWSNGKPIQFSLGKVIPGWTQGLPGMKAGGRRVLVIPGALAYGMNPPTSQIAPNETLVFVVDLVSTP